MTKEAPAPAVRETGIIRFAAFENQEMDVKFRVELVWQGSEDAASSIFLTSDGRVILQGRRRLGEERRRSRFRRKRI